MGEERGKKREKKERGPRRARAVARAPAHPPLPPTSSSTLPFSPRPQINATSFAPITAIQFGANRAYEQALAGLHLAPAGAAWPTLAAAAAAGATSTLVGNPAELVMIRQQQHATSLGAAAAGVWRQFGLRGFFRGQTMALGRESVYAACYLGLCPLLAAELEARGGGGQGSGQ